MPGMPELPVPVDPSARQVDGVVDGEPIYQTQRGKQARSRDVGGLPPDAPTPDVALRYEEEA